MSYDTSKNISLKKWKKLAVNASSKKMNNLRKKLTKSIIPITENDKKITI